MLTSSHHKELATWTAGVIVTTAAILVVSLTLDGTLGRKIAALAGDESPANRATASSPNTIKLAPTNAPSVGSISAPAAEANRAPASTTISPKSTLEITRTDENTEDAASDPSADENQPQPAVDTQKK